MVLRRGCYKGVGLTATGQTDRLDVTGIPVAVCVALMSPNLVLLVAPSTT